MPEQRRSPLADDLVAWLIGPVLLALAIWFVTDPLPGEIPSTGPSEVRPADFENPPRATMDGTAYFVPITTLCTRSFSTRSKIAMSNGSESMRSAVPALLKSTSMPPKRSATWPNAAATSSSDVTSACT